MSGDGREKARAQALGRLAARDGQPVTVCPFTKDQRVLRIRWLLAHAEESAKQATG